jgi:hypothetical protein
VARCADGTGSLVAGRSDLHPLGAPGVWERLLNLVQERGLQLGMTFLDGTSVRARQKTVGARRKGALKLNETIVKHLAALVAAMAPSLA